MSALLDLASKCEAASGPDRELFLEAFYAVHGQPLEVDKLNAVQQAEWIAAESRFLNLIRVGAWLDAAMTLVPEGFRKEVRDSDARGVWAYLFSGTEPADYIEEGATTVLNPHYGQGVTWSLALCAAALRARAAEQSALNREGGK